MTTTSPGEITALLRRIERGDAAAQNELAQLVRASLKRIAANRLRRERPDHLYQTSDLVQEAYLRLFNLKNIHWEGHEHFFKVAALQMRRILIEYARKEYRDNPRRVPLEEVPGLTFNRDADLLRVNEVLDDLARIDPRRAEIAVLKYFGGYGIEEIARITGISAGTVKRQWATAKAFIRLQLGSVAQTRIVD
jgi:RNA polymerase sigma factor (TIGR02999 family)